MGVEKLRGLNEVLGGALQAEVALVEGVEAQWVSDADSA